MHVFLRRKGLEERDANRQKGNQTHLPAADQSISVPYSNRKGDATLVAACTVQGVSI